MEALSKDATTGDVNFLNGGQPPGMLRAAKEPGEDDCRLLATGLFVNLDKCTLLDWLEAQAAAEYTT